MQAFDASSMIYAWDNYPLEQFLGLWMWIDEQIKSGEFVMSEVAFGEVKGKAPDCADWLEKHAIKPLPRTSDTLQIALMLKRLARYRK